MRTAMLMFMFYAMSVAGLACSSKDATTTEQPPSKWQRKVKNTPARAHWRAPMKIGVASIRYLNRSAPSVTLRWPLLSRRPTTGV